MFKLTSCAQVAVTTFYRHFPPKEHEREELQISIGSHPLALLYNDAELFTDSSRDFFRESCPKLFEEFKEVWQAATNKESYLAVKSKNIKEFALKKYKTLDEEKATAVAQTIEKIMRIAIRDVFNHIPQLINAMSFHGLIENNMKISINMWNNERHLASRTRPYQLERPELDHGEIGYINGIMQTFENATNDATMISDNLCEGANVHGIYSATHGALGDLKILFIGQTGISPEPVQQLLDQWNAFFLREADPTKRFLQICMSQGAIMVKLALEQLPDRFRKRICVLAIAPAGFIPIKAGCQVRHFVKMNDIVPVAMASGRSRLHGDDPEIIRVLSDDGGNPHYPHGRNYVDAMKPFVKRYINTNSILEN